MYKVILPNGTEQEYSEETTLLDISKEFADGFSSPIVSGLINGEEKDLQYKITDGARVGFIELASPLGMRVYTSSLIMVLYTAMLECLPGLPHLLVKSQFSNNVYCEAVTEELLPEDYIDILRKRMQEIIDQNEPIIYQRISRIVTEKILKKQGNYDRLGLIGQLDPDKETISSYSCRGVQAYFFSPMVPYAGYLKSFDIMEYHGRILLRYPAAKNPFVMEPFVNQPKLSEALAESEKWNRIIGCDTINKLNNIIKEGGITSIIKVAEALHEKKIASIADMIAAAGKKAKVILIAGPSSSGKTTFAQRLKIHLQVNGIVPVPLSIDDYFHNRENTPRKPNGDFDFESIHTIDLKLFNDDLKKLLDGEEIDAPTFNFKKGCREYNGNKMSVKEGQPLLIEGIHGLNDMLTSVVPLDEKIKIYISPMAQLRMDNHNLVDKTDIRLMRRMVRDNRTRGHDARGTIRQWQYVLEGEEENIYPFQESASVMFNTALIYEMGVLKKYAQPLLKEIKNDEPEYTTAKRLLNLLDYVESIEDSEVTRNSLLREFIGGSWFHEE